MTRNWHIASLHRSGFTFKELGKRFKISPQRASQIVAAEARNAKLKASEDVRRRYRSGRRVTDPIDEVF